MYSAVLSRLGLIVLIRVVVRPHVTIHKRHRRGVVVPLAGDALVGAVDERPPHGERPVTTCFLLRVGDVDALNRAFHRTQLHLVTAREIAAFLTLPPRHLSEKVGVLPVADAVCVEPPLVMLLGCTLKLVVPQIGAAVRLIRWCVTINEREPGFLPCKRHALVQFNQALEPLARRNHPKLGDDTERCLHYRPCTSCCLSQAGATDCYT